MKLNDEIGMAGPRNTQIRFVGIITSTIQTYAHGLYPLIRRTLNQQRGQNLLVQWCQSTVSLRIASLAATGINKRRFQIVAALE